MTATTFPFVKNLVDEAPENAGVYALFQNGVLIYYGRAQGGNVTIRSRLQSHQRGGEGYCTQQATHYQWEICSNPIAREVELLAGYRAKFGTLPRCNQRVG